MSIKPLTALLISVIICCMGVFLTITTGIWNTESTRSPAKFENAGELDGQYRADDIRGSYTFGEISTLYGVPLDNLATAFHVPIEDAPNFQCKNLETLFSDSSEEIGTGSVRLFVAFYLGQPLDLSEDTYIPQSGADIIDAYGQPLEEQKNYLTSHVLSTSLTNQATEPETSLNQKSDEMLKETIDIKGATYIKDLSNTYGVPLEDIEKAFMLSKLEVENFQVKDIKNKFSNSDVEIGTTSVKLFIVFYKGIPYDLSQTEAFFTSDSAEIIKSKGTPLEEQLEYLNTHTAP